jgi:hypothetical protein
MEMPDADPEMCSELLFRNPGRCESWCIDIHALAGLSTRVRFAAPRSYASFRGGERRRFSYADLVAGNRYGGVIANHSFACSSVASSR